MGSIDTQARVWTGAPALDRKLDTIWQHVPYVTVDDPAAADQLLYPHLIHQDPVDLAELAREHLDLSKRLGKRLLLFVLSDHEEPFPEARSHDVTIFRTSLRASDRSENERVLPYVWGCREEAPFPAREPAARRPVVGFCGTLRSHPIRPACARKLRRSWRIRTRFVVRKRFWGGRPHEPEVVREFFENIRDSDFTLAPRGRGNFSIRFYQTLSCGRIPIVPDTDTLLPFADRIPWRSISVVAPTPADLPRLALEFWRREHVARVQAQCRSVWEEFLSARGFAAQLAATLRWPTPPGA